METEINRQVILARRPDGAPTEDVFSFAEAPVPEPGENEYVVRIDVLAMDPALVGRMRAEQNYAESATPGEVMHAYGVGEVVASNWDGAPVGQKRFGRFDMLRDKLGAFIGDQIDLAAAELAHMERGIARRVQLKRRAARRAFKRLG